MCVETEAQQEVTRVTGLVAQQFEEAHTEPDGLTLGPTWWKEKTNSYKLSCCTYPHPTLDPK